MGLPDKAAGRDYSKEAAYLKRTAHERALRNKARREAIEDGRAHKGDGKDVDHKTPLSKGGSNADSNTRVVPASENRSFARNNRSGLTSQFSKRER